MTIPREHWEKFQEYIRSGGQNPVIRETYLIDHSVELVRHAQELQEAVDSLAGLLKSACVEVNNPDSPDHGCEGTVRDFWPDGVLLVRHGAADYGYHASQLVLRHAVLPSWHRFDKDEESTWPAAGRYWIYVAGEGVRDDHWLDELFLFDWANWPASLVTHYMPFVAPVPPSEAK